MTSRILKTRRARIIALAVAAGVLASLATAPASLAAAPQLGNNCQPDGKINGAGATFQTNAQGAFINGYLNDVCGSQTVTSGLNGSWGATDPSNFTYGSPAVTLTGGMAAYNYSLSGTAASNGSGAGLTRIQCRTDFYAGSDIPYNAAQLTAINGAPCPTGTGTLNLVAVPPPFGPQPSSGPWPATGDTARAAMNYPVAGGAVALGVNLNGLGCTAIPSGINLTAWEFDRIMKGTINQWDDANLQATNNGVGGNPSLAGCHGAIHRVVRADNSGTTAITMYTLFGGKTASLDSAKLCGSENPTHNNHTWLEIATMSANQNNWPVANGTAPDCVDANNNPASPTVVPGSTGSGAVITTTDTTNGAVGYAELGLWPSPLPAGVVFASVQTHDDFVSAGNGDGVTNPGPDPAGNPAFVSPGNPGAASTCKIPTTFPISPPSANAAVGLLANNWRNDTTGSQNQNIAFSGFGFPACGVTFDFVYSGLHFGQANEIAGYTAGNFTPGCQIAGAQLATTANGAQTIAAGGTLVTNGPLTSWPATGTISINASTFTYTGKSGNSLTGVNPGVTVANGDAVTLVSTKSAATTTTVGITGACQTTTGSGSAITPMVGMANDQVRTLYSYMTYVLSPLGQATLAAQTYDQLPATWLGLETQGFQANF